ncbi:MAG: hypothetical protein IT438_10480 [Phycisphaerales bacterium]|nr:hypothetical protein [Phycisphaerales bacterium]
MTHPPFRPPHSHLADPKAEQAAKPTNPGCCGRENCCDKAHHDTAAAKSPNTPGINSVSNSPSSGKKSPRNASAA